jgi:hypothetical protein
MMRRLLWFVVAGVVLHGCSEIPPLATVPSPPVPPSIPATIALTWVGGVGATAGTVYLAAVVKDASGKGVPAATVRYSTTTGVVQPATVVADAGGLAQATVTTSSTATITAAAGSVTASITVTPSAPITPTPSQPAVPPPAPPGPPPPGALTVTIFATPGIAGTSTTFSLATQALSQAVWTFGDSSPSVTTSTGFTTHVYAAAGIYPVGVTVTDTLGRTASTTQNVTISGGTPPAPPASGYILTMGCTAAAHGTATVCNLAVARDGTRLPSSAFCEVDVDFGDGRLDQFHDKPLISRVYAQAGTYMIVATAQIKADATDTRLCFPPPGLPYTGLLNLATVSQSVVVP